MSLLETKDNSEKYQLENNSSEKKARKEKIKKERKRLNRIYETEIKPLLPKN